MLQGVSVRDKGAWLSKGPRVPPRGCESPSSSISPTFTGNAGSSSPKAQVLVAGMSACLAVRGEETQGTWRPHCAPTLPAPCREGKGMTLVLGIRSGAINQDEESGGRDRKGEGE